MKADDGYRPRHVSQRPDGVWYAEVWQTTFREWHNGDRRPGYFGRGATPEEAIAAAMEIDPLNEVSPDTMRKDKPPVTETAQTPGVLEAARHSIARSVGHEAERMANALLMTPDKPDWKRVKFGRFTVTVEWQP